MHDRLLNGGMIPTWSKVPAYLDLPHAAPVHRARVVQHDLPVRIGRSSLTKMITIGLLLHHHNTIRATSHVSSAFHLYHPVIIHRNIKTPHVSYHCNDH